MRLAPLHAIALFILSAVAIPAFAVDPPTERRALDIVELRDRTPEHTKALVTWLSDAEVDTLIREQDAIDRLLATTPDPAAMPPEDRETLWNSTKVIDSPIEGDRRIADERLICRQERRVGSKLAHRNCRTQAELDAACGRGREEVERAQNKSRL